MALLGTGFDPGVTSVFSAYALKHYFDQSRYPSIFWTATVATTVIPLLLTLIPKVNLREVSAPGSYWENGKWVENSCNVLLNVSITSR